MVSEDRKMQESSSAHTMVVAIKKIRLGDKDQGLPREALREIKLLQELNHSNVIHCLDVFTHHGNVHIVLPYLDIDLEKIIVSNDHILTPGDVKRIMLMILEGIKHCHDNWVLHRDIKPANYLLDTVTGQLQLADFGLSKVFGSPNRAMTPQVCTLWYRAPELLYGCKTYGTGCDMWSIGCVFAEIMTGVPLFGGTENTEMSQLSRIFEIRGTPSSDSKSPSHWHGVNLLPSYVEYTPATEMKPWSTVCPACPADALDLLDGLLSLSPRKRLTAAQALAHPYFTNAPAPSDPHEIFKAHA
jgi:cyclin-dependent kinase 7